MAEITEALLRSKAEHNQGMLNDLEEISLHQLELCRISVVGHMCRKLKILYLQNNIIPKIEGLEHLKDLEYINLALNNVTKIEGLQHCEFLNKLDLTVNFIDLDALEASVSHLAKLRSLKELFLMGNPCQEWPGCNNYIIARVPQIQSMDGKDISRTDRIVAAQQFPKLEKELRELAAKMREEKGLPEVGVEESKGTDVADDDDDSAPWTPQTRIDIAKESHERKQQEEERRKEMQAPERNFEEEQREALEKARKTDATFKDGRVRQCNEGRYAFELIDEDGKGNCVLRVPLPKFMDTSLVAVDNHPTHVTLVIKSKVLRLAWPEPVNCDSGKAQRSKTTGELVLTVPKVDQESRRAKMARSLLEKQKEQDKEEAKKGKGKTGKMKLGEQLIAEANKAVSVRGIVKQKDEDKAEPLMSAKSTTRYNGGSGDEEGNHVTEAAGGAGSAAGVGAGAGAGTEDFVDNPDVPPLE